MVGARPPAGMAQGRKARGAHALTTGAAGEGCQPGALHVSGCSSRRASSASTRASCTSWRTSRRCWTLRSSWSTVGAVRGALNLERRGLAAWPSSQFGARPGGALASLGTARGLGLVAIAVQSWSSTRRLALVVCSGWLTVFPGYVDWCTEVDQVACEPVEGY